MESDVSVFVAVNGSVFAMSSDSVFVAVQGLVFVAAADAVVVAARTRRRSMPPSVGWSRGFRRRPQRDWCFRHLEGRWGCEQSVCAFPRSLPYGFRDLQMRIGENREPLNSKS
jgi:hypothetical protein